MQKTYNFVFGLLGVLVAAPSLISIIQREFEFGLAPAFARLLEFYRNLVEPFSSALQGWLQPLFDLLQIQVPVWLGDFHALALVSAGVIMRSVTLAQGEAGPAEMPAALSPTRFLWSFIAVIVLGLTLLSLPVILFCMAIAPYFLFREAKLKPFRPKRWHGIRDDWIYRYSGSRVRTEEERRYWELRRRWPSLLDDFEDVSLLVSLTSLATVAALVAFYVGNLLALQ